MKEEKGEIIYYEVKFENSKMQTDSIYHGHKTRSSYNEKMQTKLQKNINHSLTSFVVL